MPSNILFERDTNVQQPASNLNKSEKAQPMSMEYHRQVLEQKMKEDQQQQTYISPSDNILSPATQKLAAFKNKRMDKSVKPKSLFARTTSKNADAAMFGDIPKERSAADKDNNSTA